MSTPTWPSTLPGRFLVGTYSRSSPDGRLRSSTDIGPGKVRRRSKSSVYKIKGDMALTPAQKSALVTFFETTTLGGALPFTFTDPDDDQVTLVCRFDEEGPVFGDFAVNHFKTTLNLEVLP